MHLVPVSSPPRVARHEHARSILGTLERDARLEICEVNIYINFNEQQ